MDAVVRRILTILWGWLALVMFVASASPGPIFALPVYIAAFVSTVLLHELGHAVAAWLVGWRVVVFSVWRLAFHAQNRQFALIHRDQLQELAGWVLAVPAEPSRNTYRRFSVIVAGGPMASLLQAVVAAGSAIVAPDIHFLMMGFVVLGFGMFVFNIVPTGIGGRTSDGRKIVEIVRAIHDGKSPQNFVWAAALLRSNVRLKDVPGWMLVNSPVGADISSGLERRLAALEIGRTLDRSPVDVALARSQIDSFWEKYEPNDWLRSCDAYLAAVHEHDLARAQSMIEQFGSPGDTPEMQEAARAALYRAQGRDLPAAECLDRMDAIVRDKSPFRNFTYEEIRRRIERVMPFPHHSHSALTAAAANP